MTAPHVHALHGSIARASKDVPRGVRDSDSGGIMIDYCGLVLINVSGGRRDSHVVFISAQG